MSVTSGNVSSISVFEALRKYHVYLRDMEKHSKFDGEQHHVTCEWPEQWAERGGTHCSTHAP
jgi:hypothetical protein